MTVEGMFNARGGTQISVRAEYLKPDLDAPMRDTLRQLW
jgi:hypothetical protein